MKKRIQITVSGRVQGVFFRAYTEKKAQSLGLKGFVMNQPDGSVFIDVQGDESVLTSFTEWCNQGSPLSSVTNVCVENDLPLDHFASFDIKR